MVRAIVGLVGILAIAVGAMLLLWPRGVWRLAESRAFWPAGGSAPASFFVIAAVGIVLGLFFLYVGLKRLTIFSVLIWIIGVVLLVNCLAMAVAPRSYRSFEAAIFYSRPEAGKAVFSYVAGTVRLVVGYSLVIAALRRKPAAV
jgi:hypothetical protein